MALQWTKTLSKTDAQQETSGRLVPYLRFTRSNHTEDTQAWFREVFFGDRLWSNGHFGEHSVEETQITFTVSIDGRARGERTMKVTHDYCRQDNNNTPNTWLHYDDATCRDLRSQDLSGWRVRVERDGTGKYSFIISPA